MPKNYPKSLLYFITSLLISCGNDALTKYISQEGFAYLQVTFVRLLVGLLLLTTYGLFTGELRKPLLFPWRHLFRGSTFVIAITLWTYSLSQVHLTTGTLMTFTIPIFILLLSPPLLGEKASWRLWLPTLFGLLGITILLQPSPTSFTLNLPSLTLLTATFLFALLDIMNKKYLPQETLFSIIFYSTLVATLLSLPLATHHWTPLTSTSLPLLLLLGLGGTLIIYTLLKAFQYSDLVALAPLRYLELLLSILLSTLIFHQAPTFYHLIGSLLIIPSVLFIMYDQQKPDSK